MYVGIVDSALRDIPLVLDGDFIKFLHSANRRQSSRALDFSLFHPVAN